MSTKSGVFIVAAKRTAFGTFGGTLKSYSAIDLAEKAARACVEASGIKASHVDSIIFGNVVQTSSDALYLARHIGLRIGIPDNVPALIVNRLCGSGFQAIVNAAHEILIKDSNLVLTGGTESMSAAPFAVHNIRFGTSLGKKYEFSDILWEALTDSHIKTAMGMTAEKLGDKYNVTREDADKYALRSQTLWRKGQDSGYFKDEIAPIEIKTKKGTVMFEVDEHPRQSTLASLAKLPPVFRKNGLINAGNASGICDGAAALLVCGDNALSQYNLKPLVRVAGWYIVGVDPSIMGFGPVPAIKGLLKKTKLTLNDIDLIEVNEAFAPQVLAVQKALNIPSEKLNVNGGAIALGHPLAASGARISTHLVYEMRRRNVKYGIGSACIGGGQGIAILFENMN